MVGYLKLRAVPLSDGFRIFNTFSRLVKRVLACLYSVSLAN